ncbi:MAG: hypothetical protein RL260_3712, partial [Pseudomonadota bacterium]
MISAWRSPAMPFPRVNVQRGRVAHRDRAGNDRHTDTRSDQTTHRSEPPDLNPHV